MVSISKTKAAKRLAAVQKSKKAALSETEEEALKVRENMARLKALRLAKEAADQAIDPAKKSK
ncbi:hypothetical protein SAMN06265368_2200 [Cohaesibacter gelatinilyticus]|uniref:Uncharacterized protein n=2 Tax=Cohaesibacter gelatinilyticus TaxID=372072 RepID=A0A285PBI1_9HYPH|nr:hypothetical protein SAMN06265368_2200 [Cohaesibacter gelatinilyticus]